MKSFIEYINEARSHPDQNPKITAFQGLEKYINDPKYFITFTQNLSSGTDRGDGGKVGMNPRTRYKTPAGVYSYRLVDYRSELLRQHKPSSTFPWASHEPLIYVLKERPGSNPLVIKDYKKSDLVNDLDYLIRNGYIVNKIVLRELRRDLKKYYNIDFSITGKLLLELQEQKKRPEFNAGIDSIGNDAGFVDILRIVLKDQDKEFERTRAIYENMKLFDEQIHKHWQIPYLSTRPSDNMWVSYMWNVTRMLHRDSVYKWTKLLIDMGYTHVIDTGLGVIHPNEPKQTLWLSPKAYEVIDLVENKNRTDRTPEIIRVDNAIDFMEDTIIHIWGLSTEPGNGDIWLNLEEKLDQIVFKNKNYVKIPTEHQPYKIFELNFTAKDLYDAIKKHPKFETPFFVLKLLKTIPYVFGERQNEKIPDDIFDLMTDVPYFGARADSVRIIMKNVFGKSIETEEIKELYKQRTHNDLKMDIERELKLKNYG